MSATQYVAISRRHGPQCQFHGAVNGLSHVQIRQVYFNSGGAKSILATSLCSATTRDYKRPTLASKDVTTTRSPNSRRTNDVRAAKETSLPRVYISRRPIHHSRVIRNDTLDQSKVATSAFVAGESPSRHRAAAAFQLVSVNRQITSCFDLRLPNQS